MCRAWHGVHAVERTFSLRASQRNSRRLCEWAENLRFNCINKWLAGTVRTYYVHTATSNGYIPFRKSYIRRSIFTSQLSQRVWLCANTPKSCLAGVFTTICEQSHFVFDRSRRKYQFFYPVRSLIAIVYSACTYFFFFFSIFWFLHCLWMSMLTPNKWEFWIVRCARERLKTLQPSLSHSIERS